MKDLSLELEQLQKKQEDLQVQLSSPYLEGAKRSSLQRELSIISTLLQKWQEYAKIKSLLDDAAAQNKTVTDSELQALFEQEIADLTIQLSKVESEIEEIINPPDPLIPDRYFWEIRAGTGGQEASLFAADLLRMYTNYAIKRGWKVSVASLNETDLVVCERLFCILKEAVFTAC